MHVLPILNYKRITFCSFILLICCIIIILIACDNTDDIFDNQSDVSINRGAFALSITWPEGMPMSSDGIDCSDALISKIIGRMYDHSGVLIGSAEFNCTFHRGILKNIKAGNNRRAEVIGLNSKGNVICRGEENGITIKQGAVTQSKGILMKLPVSNNNDPVANILSPKHGDVFDYGDNINFKGVGEDFKDGDILGSALIWQSNIDGMLDKGSEFNKKDLSVGKHIITLTVTDSDDNITTSKISIFVINEMWNKTFGGTYYDEARSGMETSDGGYIILGSTASYGSGNSDAWLIKTNDQGNMLWSKTFDIGFGDETSSVQETRNGGFILAGDAILDEGYMFTWLIRTDKNGKEIWRKTYGGGIDSWVNHIGCNVQETSDEGFIFTFTSYSSNQFTTGDVKLVKTDDEGNVLWENTYTNFDSVSSVQETTDGGYVIVGDHYNLDIADYRAWLLRTDYQGKTLWNKILGDTSGHAYSLQETVDKGFIISGIAGIGNPHNGGDVDAWLIKTNEKGIQQWKKTYSGASDDFAYSVNITSDGGYIITGSTRSYGGRDSDVWVIKTDGDGNREWDKTFGGALDDFAYSVNITSDGGYIITGSTESYGNGDSDAWVIKIM